MPFDFGDIDRRKKDSGLQRFSSAMHDLATYQDEAVLLMDWMETYGVVAGTSPMWQRARQSHADLKEACLFLATVWANPDLAELGAKPEG